MSELKNAQRRVKAERGFVVEPPPHRRSLDSLAELEAQAARLRAKGPLLADLFSGCGGLSLGAEAAGYVPVLAVDHDPLALETWRGLFPGVGMQADLSDPDVVDEIARVLSSIEVDAIVGGPPCQPFSRAGRSLLRHLVATGKRDAHDQRRELWRSFIDIVLEARPSVVLMENVPELALGDDTLLLRTIVDELEREGYAVATRIVATTEHGVPQFRQRIIIVGLLNGTHYTWPAVEEWYPTVRMAIGDLPPVDPGWARLESADGFDIYEEPERASELTRWLRSGVPEAERERVYDHVTRSVRDDDRLIFDSMDSSTKYSDIDPALKRYRDDIFDDKYKRLDWDQPSRSITAHLAKDGYWYIHPSQPRTLTIREAARIQTFPDRVRFAGPPSASLRQIGNAVPPLAARSLLRSARESLERGEPEARPTRAISERLAQWFLSREPLTIPWLDRDRATAWQVIQCELLGLRGDDSATRALWPVWQQMPTPQATLDRRDRLRILLGNNQRAARLDTVLAAAAWFQEEAEENPFLDADRMAANPHVGSAIAGLAELVACPDESPTIAASGVLRVAARHGGASVDSVNRGTDGRVAVARLIGGSVFDVSPDAPRFAHLALFELAASVCHLRRPQCGSCPLQDTCAFASNNPPDPQLF